MANNDRQYIELNAAACHALIRLGAQSADVEEFAARSVATFLKKYASGKGRVLHPKALVKKVAVRDYLREQRRNKKRVQVEKERLSENNKQATNPSRQLESAELSLTFGELVAEFTGQQNTSETTLLCLTEIQRGLTAQEIEKLHSLPTGKVRSCWASFVRFVKSRPELVSKLELLL